MIHLNFNYVNTNETEFHCKKSNTISLLLYFINSSQFLVYMDNQTLCNQGIIDLNNIHTWTIYSHIYYHVNKYLN